MTQGPPFGLFICPILLSVAIPEEKSETRAPQDIAQSNRDEV